MNLSRPRSLRLQTISTMLLGLVLSHMIAIGIYSSDRGDAITRAEAEDMVERIAGTVILMSELDPAVRTEVARASETTEFAVTVANVPALRADAPHQPGSMLLEPRLRSLFPGLRNELFVFESDSAAGPYGSHIARIGRMLLRTLNPTHQGEPAEVHELQSSVLLNSGEWLNFHTTIPVRAAHWPGAAGYYIVAVAGLFLVLSAWMVNRVTAPLKSFAEAADRLGKDIAATPLVEDGPREVVHAVRAFNAMQNRLKRLIEHRTQMLAAISHDLRTPITLLRLRSELLENADTRARFIDTLDEMNAMIDSFVDFARQTSQNEPLRQVDISALVVSACDDACEAGLPVEAEIAEAIICSCRPREIQRAVANLIDNAVKYGKRAHINVGLGKCRVEITVRDEGPGIPPDQIEQVCVPFFRGEASRNPETGGVGLGLSTAQAIVCGHGGELSLSNHPDRGLLARISLPL
jgi:signal transduction histidine kinase